MPRLNLTSLLSKSLVFCSLLYPSCRVATAQSALSTGPANPTSQNAAPANPGQPGPAPTSPAQNNGTGVKPPSNAAPSNSTPPNAQQPGAQPGALPANAVPPNAPQAETFMINSRLHYYSPELENPYPRTIDTDVCIYGGTSAGIIAAIQLRQMGKQVVLVEPSDHIGGMTTGGLSFTDIGNKAAIGGLSREFYRRTGRHYGQEEEEWRFEPHVAEAVFKEWIEESDVLVLRRNFLQQVKTAGGRITEIQTRGGATIRAKMFMDCTYEGDLMAFAGVTHRIGREDNSEHGELLNGVQMRDKHQFNFAVDPFVIPGDPSSGLLPTVQPHPPGREGQGDMSVQAYNFRLCLTRDADNKIPYPKPENYDPKKYELLARYFKTEWTGDQIFYGWGMLRNNKADLNNSGAVSTDYIGMNHHYPTGTYLDRERIFQDHLNYQMGLLWFLANDPQVPERIRARVNNWGLAKDEFVETGGWTHQLYIREARRMVAPYTMTEHNCRGTVVAEDPIGLAAYTMDSHNCNRFLLDGKVMNEGDVQVGGFPPYPISYRSITPRKNECENLLVPVCLGCTHIAYGSIRMEPVFMVLGHSAAVAASMAIDRNCAVQDVPYPELRRKLEEDQQILEWKKQ